MLHHHHARSPAWPPILAAALVGYALGAAGTAQLRRQLNAARHAALHDALTGLPNRRAAIDELRHRLTTGIGSLLAILDLDHFKDVNDRYGHTTGDDLLTIVATRLYLTIPPRGYAARLAGDEFLLLLPDHGDPAGMIDPVLALLAEPVRLGAATLRPHASAGVTTITGCAASWRRLLGQADAALYRAKHTHTSVAVYDRQLDGDIPENATRPRTRRPDRDCGHT